MAGIKGKSIHHLIGLQNKHHVHLTHYFFFMAFIRNSVVVLQRKYLFVHKQFRGANRCVF